MKNGSCYIGTSGWSYPHWKEGFYEKKPAKEWFSFYSRRFTTVEINATFYGNMSKKTYDAWYKKSPENFQFSLKGSHHITHRYRLREARSLLEKEMDHDFDLKEKLAVILWQLPSSFAFNIEQLDEFCQALNEVAGGCRHTIEFRHPSWMTGAIKELLSKYNIAICISDSGSWPLWREVSADFVYLRLHGRKTYFSSYGKEELLSWAEKIKAWKNEGRNVYVYFNNDVSGAAPRDAALLQSLLDESS